MVALGYVLLCLIWGSTWLAIKTGLDAGMPPLLGASLRFAVASVILAPFVLTTSRVVLRDRVAWRLALMLGVLSFGVGYGCTYIGGLHVPSGLGSLTFGVFPFWVAILAHFMLRDRLTAGTTGGQPHEPAGRRQPVGADVSKSSLVLPRSVE